MMKALIRRYAKGGLAASDGAAEDLYGIDWKSDDRWRVLFCGIDLSGFLAEVDCATVRRELALPEDAFVVGHVGRFSQQKNHEFLVSVASEIVRCEDNAYFLLIGEGPLKDKIEAKVTEAGLRKRFRFVGYREDVPRIMRGAMDVFLFPSFWEGLGLVMIEAQAAGLPTVCSDQVPLEAHVVPNLVTRVTLSAPAAIWAKKVLETRKGAGKIEGAAGLRVVERSLFNIDRSVEELQRFYLELARKCL